MRRTPTSTFAVDDVGRAAPSLVDDTPLVGTTSILLLLIGESHARPSIILLDDLVVDDVDGVAHGEVG
jgi:hypothetical protein